jgi:two-component system sensor histidine kinase/response regulator
MAGTADQKIRASATDQLSLREAKPRLHILVAEDNAVNQVLARRLLEKMGHTVVVANNGFEAVQAILGTESFDAVLMDVQMPELDGLEATKAIREAEQSSRNHLPIIALTAHAMKGDEERCLATGMDGYISKPIRSTELATILERLVPTRLHPGAKISAPSDHMTM